MCFVCEDATTHAVFCEQSRAMRAIRSVPLALSVWPAIGRLCFHTAVLIGRRRCVLEIAWLKIALVGGGY